jgi:hypothetical protein
MRQMQLSELRQVEHLCSYFTSKLRPKWPRHTTSMIKQLQDARYSLVFQTYPNAMKTFLEWFLLVPLVAYVWCYRSNSQALVAGAPYFLVAGLFGTFARELQAFRRRNKSLLAWAASDPRAESFVLATGYVLCLLAFLNSATVAPKAPAASVLLAGSWLICTVAFFSLAGDIEMHAPRTFRTLPPIFVFANLYLFLAVLVPATIFVSSRRVNMTPDFASPTALALLFAALCSVSFGAALFRPSSLSTLPSRSRAYLGAALISVLGVAAVSQYLSGAGWYSFILSSMVIIGITLGGLRLSQEYRKEGGAGGGPRAH